MSASEPLKATNLNGSLKETGTQTKQNRGEGMKVASLNYNPLGVVWRSCKDGEVSETSLGRSANGWVRAVKTYEDGSTAEAWDVDLTDHERENHYKIDGDWTEVVFLGRRADQNTFTDPYEGKEASEETIRTDLLNRYFDIPPIARVGLPVEVLYQSDAVRTDAGIEGDAIGFPAEILRAEKNYRRERLPLKGFAGVEVEFIHALNTPAKKRFPARCGFVCGNEQYRPRMGHNWRNQSVFFGLVGLGGKVSVLVHYPEEAARADRYRESLVHMDSPERISIDEMRAAIVATRPAWVVKLLNANSANPSYDIDRDLRAFLDTLQAQKSAQGDLKALAGGTSGPSKSTGKINANLGHIKTGTTETNAKIKPGGRARVRNILPKVEWLKDAKDIPKLHQRTAIFVGSDEGGIIYMNRASPMIEGYVRTVVTSTLDPNVREVTQAYVTEKLWHHVSARVATMVVHQQYLRNSPGYSESDTDEGLDIPALNAVVLAVAQELPEWALALSKKRGYERRAQGLIDDEAADEIDTVISAKVSDDVIVMAS